MSEPEDIAQDAAHDAYIESIIDEFAPEYIAEHSEEIVEKYQQAGLYDEIVHSHKCAMIEATLSFERSYQQVENGLVPEALFNAFRALEGYCTDVFITSLHSVFTTPFDTLLGDLNVRATDVFGRSLNQKATFVYVGLYAITSRDVATAIRKKFSDYLQKHWKARNAVFHSFWSAPSQEAKDHIARAHEILRIIAQPLVEIHERRERDAQLAAQRAARPRAYFDDF